MKAVVWGFKFYEEAFPLSVPSFKQSFKMLGEF